MEDKFALFENLTPDQLDAIREIASIGSGHSASALSDLLMKNIQMKVPKVRVIPMEDIAYELLDEKSRTDTVAGLFIETEDEYPMDVIILLNQKTINFLISNIISEKQKFDIFDLDEVESSLIEEIGNILTLQYISALESFTGMEIRPKGTPLLTIDIAEAIINAILMKSGDDFPSLLLIENVLFSDKHEVNATSLLILSEKVLDKFLEQLFP
ncbi:MAG: chemotaxis protein CheC [Candidatus Hodarchaeales archaeon]|jgi:chemotaxis protein CheC